MTGTAFPHWRFCLPFFRHGCCFNHRRFRFGLRFNNRVLGCRREDRLRFRFDTLEGYIVFDIVRLHRLSHHPWLCYTWSARPMHLWHLISWENPQDSLTVSFKPE
jgi:hypothetical protein